MSSSGKPGTSLAPYTSESKPIQVSWLHTSADVTGRRLGLVYCPGKTVTRNRGGGLWARDLAADLARLRGFGVVTLVCLLNR